MVAEDVWAKGVVAQKDVPAKFDELMLRVEDGETIAIVRGGKVIARLTPADETMFDPKIAEEAVNRFLDERRKWPPTNVTREEILAWRHEGHRW